MARGVNKVILVGNLGQDPELRYTGNGTAVCNIRLATTETYKDAEGNNVEKTEWHSVVVWGRMAEICGEYLKKGSQAYFEGSLQTRSYEDKDGNTRYTTEVKAREMLLLGGRGGASSDDSFDEPRQAPRQQGGGRAPQGGTRGAQGGGRGTYQENRPPKNNNNNRERSTDYDQDAFGPDEDLPF